MTMKEFLDKHYLHDSYFASVNFNQAEHKLTLLIHFCSWMQEDYVEGSPELELLEVIFHDVETYSCPDGDPCGDVGILDAELNEQGECVISMMDDTENKYFEMHIFAHDASVTHIPE